MRTKIKTTCVNCGSEFERHGGRPNSKFCSRKCSALFRYKQDKTLGKKLTEKAHEKLRGGATAGEKNYKWKGGRRSTRGYVVIGSGNKKQREHIIVAEKMAGRKLRSNEIVHHINGIKNDNREINLIIMDRAEHTALHNKSYVKNNCRD